MRWLLCNLQKGVLVWCVKAWEVVWFFCSEPRAFKLTNIHVQSELIKEASILQTNRILTAQIKVLSVKKTTFYSPESNRIAEEVKFTFKICTDLPLQTSHIACGLKPLIRLSILKLGYLKQLSMRRHLMKFYIINYLLSPIFDLLALTTIYI
jgi:hypothetical protein